MSKSKKDIVKISPAEIVINRIYIIRGHKVMLDYDLAELYGVETRALNQAVKRNTDKFPDEFVFRLSKKEWIQMMSQIVISSSQNNDFQPDKNMISQTVISYSKRKMTAPPYAFTEHGVAMAATVLKSEKAAKMSVAIIKTFIQLRKQLLDYDSLTKQIKALKHHLDGHDAQLNQIYDAIENLLDEKAEQKSWENRPRIGFK